jgi:hypothetical protein
MRIPEVESYDGEDILEFRMENGLEQLATLQQITSLEFSEGSNNGEYFPQLGKDEIVWMVAHWKKLKNLTGELNYDHDEDSRLKTVLELLGVNTEAWPYGSFSA